MQIVRRKRDRTKELEIVQIHGERSDFLGIVHAVIDEQPLVRDEVHHLVHRQECDPLTESSAQGIASGPGTRFGAVA